MSEEQGNLKDLQNFFKKRNQEVREENNEMTQIIGPSLAKIDESGLTEEEKDTKRSKLTDLGKFIQVFDDSIYIQELITDTSDFSINKKGTLVNLEHHNFNGHFETRNNELKLDTVQKSIRLKEKANNADTRSSNKTWLLLVIGGTQNFEEYSSIENSILKEPFESSFDKIILFNISKKKVANLKLK